MLKIIGFSFIVILNLVIVNVGQTLGEAPCSGRLKTLTKSIVTQRQQKLHGQALTK